MEYTAREILEKQKMVMADNTLIELPKNEMDLENITFCTTTFRGYAPEIKKLFDYLSDVGGDYSGVEDVEGNEYIKELYVREYNILPLIEKFPLLKATGFYENWDRSKDYSVYVFYSKSGSACLDNICFAGAFEGDAEGGDGRWEWEHDVFDSVYIEPDKEGWLSIWVDYHYPFRGMWEENNELLSLDGKYYVKKTFDENEEPVEKSKVEDFEIDKGILKKYNGSATYVVIPEGVTGVARRSFPFANNENIETLVIPGTMETVEDFGRNVFPKLKKIIIEEGAKTIDSSAFTKCCSLKEVIMSDSVETVEFGAFRGCQSLKRIKFSKNLETIGKQAFYECSILENIDLSNGVKRIEDFAFSYCYCLKDVKLPNNLEYIGQNAFEHTKYNVFEHELPVNLKDVGFDSNIDRNIIQTSIDNNQTRIITNGSNLIRYYASGGTKQIRIPEGITHIGESSIRGVNFQTVELPHTVQTIGKSAFSGKELETIKLNEGLTDIGRWAFSWCSSLKHIKLPKSLSSLGESVFQRCESLEEIELPTEVKTIPKEAFYYCHSLKNVTVLGEVTVIKCDAFAECTSLKNANIPESIKTIERNAFYNCINLSLNKLPDNLEEIGEKGFINCRNITVGELPANLADIGDYAFADCENLSITMIPASVRKLGRFAFKGCKSIKELKISSEIDFIPANCFSECTNLEKVIIEGKVKKISGKTFYGCKNLKDIYIYSDLGKKHGKNNFTGCHPDLTIHGKAGSNAEQLAKDNNLRFEES